VRIEHASYSGSRPRLADYLLGQTQAALAVDCRFEHGTLDAWREPLPIHTVPTGTQSVVRYDCCWIGAYAECVDYAFGPATCSHVYLTGRSGYPEVDVVDLGECQVTATYKLGIDMPGSTFATVLSAPGVEKNQEGRVYTYLYENALGQRSSLALASDPVFTEDGATVVVSGWPTSFAATLGIRRIMIYRSVSAVGAGMSNVSADNSPDTTWMLVGTLDISGTTVAGSLMDSNYNEDLAVALEYEGPADPPPADLQGIMAVESMNCLAGFVGKRLYFSENNRYHSWPIFLDLDDSIRGIAESNQVLYIATDGHPYVVTAAADCATADCRRAVRLPLSLPMAAYGNRHMAATPFGAVYPSHNGLVGLAGSSLPTFVTNPLYAPEDWHRLRPDTILPAMHEGKLFVFGRGGSFVMKLLDGVEGGWDSDSHTSLSIRDVRQAFVDRSGNLCLLRHDSVHLWNRGAALMPYIWRSPLWLTPTPVAFGAWYLRTDGGPVALSIRVDGHKAVDAPVLQTGPGVLPMWASGTEWQIELTGTAKVGPFRLATAMEDL